MCHFPSPFLQCKWANSAKEWPFCHVWLAVWSCLYSLWFYTCSRHNPKILYFHEMLSVLSLSLCLSLSLKRLHRKWCMNTYNTSSCLGALRFSFHNTIFREMADNVQCSIICFSQHNFRKITTAIYMLNSLFKQKCKETCSSHWLLPRKLQLQRSQIKHLKKREKKRIM